MEWEHGKQGGYLGGWGSQFSKQKKFVNNGVQISSPQLLLSKRYSRLKLPFYNRFPMGDTHFLGGIPHRKSNVKWRIPHSKSIVEWQLTSTLYLLLRSNCGLDIWTLLFTFSKEHFWLRKSPQPPKVCSN